MRLEIMLFVGFVILLPFMAVSFWNSLISISKLKLLTVMLAIIVVGAAWLMDMIDIIFAWASSEGNIFYLLYSGGSVAAALLLAWCGIRCYQFLSLLWPKSLNWSGFQRWCSLYLKLHGWEIKILSDGFKASKESQDITVVCRLCVDNSDLSSLSRKPQMVILTYENAPRELIYGAADLSIRLLSYKGLRDFQNLISAPIELPPSLEKVASMDGLDSAWRKLRATDGS